MYELFEDPLKNRAGQLIFPDITYLTGIVAQEIKKVKAYYRRVPHYLPPQNGIVKLLMSVAVPFEGDFQKYSDAVASVTTKLAMSLGFTAEGSPGTFHSPGPVYGPNSSDLIILTTSLFNTVDIKDTWKDLVPIRVLRHDYDNVNFAVPDGLRSTYNGTSVIELNLPLLACQYMAFRLDELTNNPDNPKSMQQFVRMYPLPNVVESHINLAVLNRFSNIVLGRAMDPYFTGHPFSVVNIAPMLDRALEKYAAYVKTAPREYRQLLAMLPSLTSNSVPEALMPPKMSNQRQVQWALDYAVLPYVSLLVKMIKLSKSKRDTYFVYHLKRGLRAIRADRKFYQRLPRHKSQEIEYYINTVIEPYL